WNRLFTAEILVTDFHSCYDQSRWSRKSASLLRALGFIRRGWRLLSWPCGPPGWRIAIWFSSPASIRHSAKGYLRKRERSSCVLERFLFASTPGRPPTTQPFGWRPRGEGQPPPMIASTATFPSITLLARPMKKPANTQKILPPVCWRQL